MLPNEMIATSPQRIHEVSSGQSLVKEADSRTVPSVKKDIFEKVVEDSDPKEEEKVDGRDVLRRLLEVLFGDFRDIIFSTSSVVGLGLPHSNKQSVQTS